MTAWAGLRTPGRRARRSGMEQEGLGGQRHPGGGEADPAARRHALGPVAGQSRLTRLAVVRSALAPAGFSALLASRTAIRRASRSARRCRRPSARPGRQEPLDFVPLTAEQFDLVIPAGLAGTREAQGLRKIPRRHGCSISWQACPDTLPPGAESTSPHCRESRQSTISTDDYSVTVSAWLRFRLCTGGQADGQRSSG